MVFVFIYSTFASYTFPKFIYLSEELYVYVAILWVLVFKWFYSAILYIQNRLFIFKIIYRTYFKYRFFSCWLIIFIFKLYTGKAHHLYHWHDVNSFIQRHFWLIYKIYLKINLQVYNRFIGNKIIVYGEYCEIN